MDTVVIDLEIQDSIVNASDWEHTERMKIACCVLYSYLENRYHVFGPNDIEHLRNLLLAADCVVGYNIIKFDLPIIFNIPSSEYVNSVKTYDILSEIWKNQGLNPKEFSDAHRGYSLDKVSRYTLGRGKSGGGAAAPFLFKQGNIYAVIDYCIHDVKLTKELFDYIIANKHIVADRYGRIVKMEIM